jgi:hypothetical protein
MLMIKKICNTNAALEHEKRFDKGVLDAYIIGFLDDAVNRLRGNLYCNLIIEVGSLKLRRHDLQDGMNYEDIRTNQQTHRVRQGRCADG